MTNGIKQTFGEIQEEAKRCLYCVDAPCQKAVRPMWMWRSLYAISVMGM